MFFTNRSDERCFTHSLCVYTVRRYFRDPSPYRSVMGADGSTGGPMCSAKELEEREEEDTLWDDRGVVDVAVGATKAVIPVEEAMTTNMAIDATFQIIIVTG